MPILTYLCSSCGHTFDRILPRLVYDLRLATACPHCDAKATPTLSLPARRNPAHGLQR